MNQMLPGRIKMLRRLGVMFLLASVVSIGTAGCLLVPVPVGGGGHHHRGR
jgi:hypothetical protein